jgi:hypothetical protein
MPYDKNGWLVDSSGNTYVHTHKMETESEMAAALSPFIGHSMYAFWGEKKAYARLVSISGTTVKVLSYRSGNIITCSVFDAFGTDCTTVSPLKGK